MEEQGKDPTEDALIKAPNQGRRQLGEMQSGTWIGMAFSNAVAFFIILTAAVVLNANGIKDIQTSSQAAEALRPVAGRFAFLLFSLGIIGTALLAVPVLAGSSAYAMGEAGQWPVGLEKKPKAARGSYWIIAVSTLVGISLNVVHEGARLGSHGGHGGGHSWDVRDLRLVNLYCGAPLPRPLNGSRPARRGPRSVFDSINPPRQGKANPRDETCPPAGGLPSK